MVRLVFGDADMNAVETSVAGSRVPIVTRSDPGAGCGIVTRERDRNGIRNGDASEVYSISRAPK